MSDQVWISAAISHASNMRPFSNERPKYPGDDEDDQWIMPEANKFGRPISAEYFPKSTWLDKDAEASDINLPLFFVAYSIPIIHQSCAEVLSQFDMGGGGLYPVEVFEKDRKTPIPGPWLCLNVGNTKSAFEPDQSPRAKYRNIRPGGVKGWRPPAPVKDGEIAVNKAALSGPDIWVDERVSNSIFLSGPLGQALKRAKADKGWMLKKCKVV